MILFLALLTVFIVSVWEPLIAAGINAVEPPAEDPIVTVVLTVAGKSPAGLVTAAIFAVTSKSSTVLSSERATEEHSPEGGLYPADVP